MISQTSFFLLSFALCLLCVDAQGMDQLQKAVSKQVDLKKTAVTTECLADITAAHCVFVKLSVVQDKAKKVRLRHYTAKLNNGNWITASENTHLATPKQQEYSSYLVFYTIREQQEKNSPTAGDKKTPVKGFSRYIEGENACSIFQKLGSLPSKQAKTQENKE